MISAISPLSAQRTISDKPDRVTQRVVEYPQIGNVHEIRATAVQNAKNLFDQLSFSKTLRLFILQNSTRACTQRLLDDHLKWDDLLEKFLDSLLMERNIKERTEGTRNIGSEAVKKRLRGACAEYFTELQLQSMAKVQSDQRGARMHLVQGTKGECLGNRYTSLSFLPEYKCRFLSPHTMELLYKNRRHAEFDALVVVEREEKQSAFILDTTTDHQLNIGKYWSDFLLKKAIETSYPKPSSFILRYTEASLYQLPKESFIIDLPCMKSIDLLMNATREKLGSKVLAELAEEK